MHEKWFLVELDLSADCGIEVWATADGELAISPVDWPEGES